MATRRGRGEGGLYWDEKRQRFIAEVTIGYTPAGKRIVRRGSGKTKTEARAKLKQVLRDHEDGLSVTSQNFTVADAVNDWLSYGLPGRTAHGREVRLPLPGAHHPRPRRPQTTRPQCERRRPVVG